jgi:hypothetical protein
MTADVLPDLQDDGERRPQAGRSGDYRVVTMVIQPTCAFGSG